MRALFKSDTLTTGLAIFSMLFGAGNLIFPLQVGLLAGDKNFISMTGLLLSAVCLPLIGLISIILYDGDYNAFFYRLGKIPGNLIILLCMLTIGPLIAMPRIVTLSHIMISPFIGDMPLMVFTALFLFLTFLGTYKERSIINFLGEIVSPALLISLGIIIIKGLFFTHNEMQHVDTNTATLFWQSLKTGYNTLDVLGTIFFASIVITIMKKNLENKEGVLTEKSLHKLAVMGLKAGTIGVLLLTIVYICMSYLGAYHGAGLGHLNEAELFSTISFRILGGRGAIIIALAVLMACYSTIIALAAVLTEYLSGKVFKGKVSYMTCLIITLIATALVSNIGFSSILKYSAPFIEIFYPVIIVITFLNIAYRIFNFKPIKTPVAITLILSTIIYFFA